MRLDQPWNPVRLCPGVFSLLSVDGIPSICPEAAIEALRAGEAARSTPDTPGSLYRPGAPCEAVLGGGSAVEAVVVAVDGQKARVLALMFGQIREMTADVDNLRLRNE
jgi:transcription antitermination factor NusG